MGGQIIDATVSEARRPRLTEAENDTVKDGEDQPSGGRRGVLRSIVSGAEAGDPRKREIDPGEA